MKRWRWLMPAWTAAGCVLVAGGDAVTGHWWHLLGVGPAAVVNTLIARENRRKAAAREAAAHRPDYAKIAALEIELGLVDPPDPGGPFLRRAQRRYPQPDPARPTEFDPDGFGWKTRGVRDK